MLPRIPYAATPVGEHRIIVEDSESVDRSLVNKETILINHVFPVPMNINDKYYKTLKHSVINLITH